MPCPPKQSKAHKTAKHSRKIHKSEDLTPDLLDKIPPRPSDLGKDGAKEWKRVCTLLFEEQLLTKWDLPTIKIMCMEWERYYHAVQDINEHGTYQTAQSGYEQQRPVVAERDKGFANYSKLLDKFGGNVVARSRMKRVQPKQEGKNPFEVL